MKIGFRIEIEKKGVGKMEDNNANGIRFKKFEVPENILVQMFLEKMRKFGNVQNGTYNQADPTAWERINCQMLVDNGEEMSPVDVDIKDVTWITTIRFSEHGEELAKADWDPQESKWINVNAPGFFDTLYDVFVRGIHETEMEMDYEDPMGCPSKYI